MNEIAIIISAFVIAFSVKLMNTHSDYKLAKNLNEQFSDWYLNKGETCSPNSAVFAELYEKRYHSKKCSASYKVSYYGTICTEKADLLLSFPSLHPALVQTEFAYLNHLEDYFLTKYKETLSIKYWINTIIFLPSKLFRYLGLNENHISAKLLTLVYWLFGLFWGAYKTQLLKFVIKQIHLKQI